MGYVSLWWWEGDGWELFEVRQEGTMGFVCFGVVWGKIGYEKFFIRPMVWRRECFSELGGFMDGF